MTAAVVFVMTIPLTFVGAAMMAAEAVAPRSSHRADRGEVMETAADRSSCPCRAAEYSPFVVASDPRTMNLPWTPYRNPLMIVVAVVTDGSSPEVPDPASAPV